MFVLEVSCNPWNCRLLRSYFSAVVTHKTTAPLSNLDAKKPRLPIDWLAKKRLQVKLRPKPDLFDMRRSLGVGFLSTHTSSDCFWRSGTTGTRAPQHIKAYPVWLLDQLNARRTVFVLFSRGLSVCLHHHFRKRVCGNAFSLAARSLLSLCLLP